MYNADRDVHECYAEIPIAFKELFEPYRYKIFYGGRGASKSTTIADTLLILASQTPLRILCARELQVSIADSVHKLLSDRIEALEYEHLFEVQNTTIFGVNGSEFLFKGVKHNAREIKSMEGIDICWVEEAENVSSNSWEILIPTIRKRGSQIWISFNPKNATDATWQRFVMDPPANSIVKKVSWRDNPFFNETELAQERLDLLRKDPEAYQHIWEGEFDTRYSGAIYAKIIAKLKQEGKLTDKVKHDPEYPVSTLWDLGYGDTTTIWFYQEAPNEVLFIDYYENNGEGIGHYCDALKERPYRYLSHFVPQDAGKKLMEANGRSIIEQAWKDHGIRMSVVPETTHANRHEGTRKVLPHCWFNSEKCADGIGALMAYHYEYDEDMQIFKKVPYHDWSSHASTAMELLPSVWKGKAITNKELDRKAIETKFFKLRSENKLDRVDPYRIKPSRK